MSPLNIVSDVVCPWCYIGKRRLDIALTEIRREFPQLELAIHWLPFELNPGLPPQGMSREEYCVRKFGSLDYANRLYDNVAANARADGLPIRLDKITVTPNTKLAHRLIWFAEQQGLSDRTVDELFAGYFVNGENVGDLETLVAIGARAGLDTATVRTFLTSNDGVEQCTLLTEQAYDSGAQGVPAYLWGEQWLFTGAQSPETIAAVLRQQLNL